jgi:hypothetical protein
MRPDTNATHAGKAAVRKRRKPRCPPDTPGVARVKLLLARLAVHRHGCVRLPKHPAPGSEKEGQAGHWETQTPQSPPPE